MLTLERSLDFYTMNEGSPTHFGEWLRLKIEASGVQLVDFAHRIRMAYPNFSDIINRNAPRKEATIKRIVDALVEMDIISDPAEAWTHARIVPEGFVVVREKGDGYLEPSDDSEEYPQELKEAMLYSNILDPEVRLYTYRLWAVQAKAHAEIAIELRKLRAEKDELTKEIDNNPD